MSNIVKHPQADELQRIQLLKDRCIEEFFRRFRALQDQEDALRHPRRGRLEVVGKIEDRRGGKR